MLEIWRFLADSDVKTNILPDSWDVNSILTFVLKFMVYGLGVAGVVGLVIVGIQYMTARDNESQMAAAKKRIFEIVIGLVAWALLFGILNWLIPGGLTLGS